VRLLSPSFGHFGYNRVIHKVPQTRILALVLPKLGARSKVRMKTIDKKIRGTKLDSSPKLVLAGISTPILDLPYLCLH